MPLEKLRQHLARGEYVQARREAERLIHYGELSGTNLITAYRGAALAHYYVQDIFAAIKLGEKALELAVSLGEAEVIARSRFDLGEFYLTLGDTHLAREHIQEFLQHRHVSPAVADLEAKAHHKLALIYRQRKEYDKAIAEHELAAELFRRDGNHRHMVEAVRGIAWCYLTTGAPEAAWPHIQQVSDYLLAHHDDELSASHLTDLAFYHRQKGNLRTSIDFCEEALMPGRPGVDDRILASACVIAGENALDLGQVSEARLLANLALDYALKAKGPFLMNKASALRRRLHEIETTRIPE